MSDSLGASRHLAPSLATGVRLFGCVAALVSLYLSPTPSSGARLSGRLFCALTCLSSFVSHHLSRTSSVSEIICLQSYVCLSRGVLFWFHHHVFFFFAFRSLSLFFIPFVSFCCLKIESCSTMVLCVLQLVSHLSPTLSPSYCLRYQCRDKQ